MTPPTIQIVNGHVDGGAAAAAAGGGQRHNMEQIEIGQGWWEWILVLSDELPI